MKAIGHTDGGTTARQWSNTPLTNPLSPHTLYIPEPGTRENIDADQFQHVGWVNPDQGNGKIFSTHANAAEYGDARPAYIRRLPQIGSRNHEVADAVARTVQGLGPDDPMDVRRSEFDALTKRFDLLVESTTARIWSLEKIRYQQPAPTPSIPTDKFLSEGAAAKPWKGVSNHDAPMTDNLFTVSTDDLMQEALEFCDTRLDEHKGSISSENAYADCNRANAYIRELIGRLRTAERLKPTAPLGGLTGTQHADLRKAIDTLEAKFSTLTGLIYTAEQSMSFYDHAFIAAYMALMGNGSYGMDETVARSHSIAGHLTRNRANQT